MKILAIKLRAIGDTVIWTSALNALKQQVPEAELHTLTYAGNVAVLMHQPAVSRAHYLRTPKALELGRKLWSLRSEKYDWLLGFHATTSLCRWSWLAGARRVALHHHSWTHTPRGSVWIPEPGRLEDAISRDYQVLRGMGLRPDRVPTSLVVSSEESQRAEETVRAKIAAVGGNVERPRFAFLPGAGHFLRRYPKDLLLPLIERMKAEGRYQPLVITDSSVSQEWELAGECRRMGVPLFDHGSLRDFICLVSRAERALANDSGPGHIAVALGLRTDFVFGPGCVGDWHPYDKNLHPVHRAMVDCRAQGPRDQEAFQFCTVNECAHRTCMRQIAPLEL